MHQTAVVHLRCEAGHPSVWRSAEEMRGSQHPEVVLQAFHSVLCSGGGFTEYEEFSRELGLKPPAERLFFEFQCGKVTRQGWIEAVIQVAAEDQASGRAFVIERDGQAGTVVYMDARFDSSRDGYHGTVPVIDMVSGKVLHVVTLTRVETGSSWKTEDACVRQALEECLEWGLKIVEVVHDDKSSVDSILTGLK